MASRQSPTPANWRGKRSREPGQWPSDTRHLITEDTGIGYGWFWLAWCVAVILAAGAILALGLHDMGAL
jgi:hypothetical protein